jgi:hypothetical protein
MWIVVGLLVGLVAVGVLLVAALIARRRGEPTRLGTQMSGDQWLTLGVVFAGAGAALMATLGIWMVGMVAIGVVYMGIGISMKRSNRD